MLSDDVRLPIAVLVLRPVLPRYTEPAERVLEVVRSKPIVRKVVLDFYRGDGSAMEAGFKHWAAVDRARAASVGA